MPANLNHCASTPTSAAASRTTYQDNNAPTTLRDNNHNKFKRFKADKTTAHRIKSNNKNYEDYEYDTDLNHDKTQNIKPLFPSVYGVVNDAIHHVERPFKITKSSMRKLKTNEFSERETQQFVYSQNEKVKTVNDNFNWVLNNFLSDTDPFSMLCPYKNHPVEDHRPLIDSLNNKTSDFIHIIEDGLEFNSTSPPNFNYPDNNYPPSPDYNIYHYIHHNYSEDNMHLNHQYEFNQYTYNQDEEHILSPPGSIDYSLDVGIDPDIDTDTDIENGSNILSTTSSKNPISCPLLSSTSLVSTLTSTETIPEKTQMLVTEPIPMFIQPMSSSPIYHDIFSFSFPLESSSTPPPLSLLNYNSYNQNRIHQDHLRALEKGIKKFSRRTGQDMTMLTADS